MEGDRERRREKKTGRDRYSERQWVGKRGKGTEKGKDIKRIYTEEERQIGRQRFPKLLQRFPKMLKRFPKVLPALPQSAPKANLRLAKLSHGGQFGEALEHFGEALEHFGEALEHFGEDFHRQSNMGYFGLII